MGAYRLITLDAAKIWTAKALSVSGVLHVNSCININHLIIQ
jgi:hypothetical protein